MVFGIRLRLAVLALALTTPTVINQLWVSAQSRQRAIERAFTRVDELAKLAAAEEDDSLQEASNLLRVLGHVPAIVFAQDECHNLLREITNEHPRLDLISVERPDGSVACTSEQPVPPTFKLADRPWFKEATAPDAPATVVSDLLVSRAKGYPGVVVASGLQFSGTAGGTGAISALMKLAWFSDIANKLSGSTGASVQIADVRSGAIIAQSSSLQGQAADHLSSRLIEAIKSSPQGIIETTSEGGEAEIIGYRWLPSDQDLHSTVLVRMRKSTVLKNANHQLLLGLSTIAVALMAGLLLAWSVAEVSIVRPLSALARMARQLSSGNLEARVALQRFGLKELSVVSETLNTAIEQIHSRDKQLEQLTLCDPLTGLANRRCFDLALEREWKRAKRSKGSIALLMIDVDCFKMYNDSYGHLAGDECLRRIADAVGRNARSALDTPARFGGEEIALLAPSIHLVDAVQLSERVVTAVRQLELPHRASPLGCVTVSVGLASVAPCSFGGTPDALIEAADRALYEAKRAGRNRAACADQVASPSELV